MSAPQVHLQYRSFSKPVSSLSASFSMADSVVTIVALLLFSNAVVSWLFQEMSAATGAAVDSDGNPIFQAIIACCYIYAGIRLWSHWADFRSVLPALLPALALVALAIASTLWADVPTLAARRGIALSGTTVFALFVALRIGAVRAMWLLAVASGIAAILSIVAVLVVPELSREAAGTHEGLWRGVFQQKNLLGRAMVIGVLAATAVAERIPSRRLAAIAIGVLCIVCLVGSGSRTALFLALLAPIVVLSSRIVTFPRARLVALALVLGGFTLTATVWAMAYSDSLFLAIGKDPTLTGRTVLWAAAISAGSASPWLGAGYKAFWIEERNLGGAITDLLGWSMSTGHNSFLDLWLELGLVGLLLALLIMGILVRDSWRVLRFAPVAPARWALAFIVVTILISFSHTVIAVQNGMFWFLQVALTVWVRRAWIPIDSSVSGSVVPRQFGGASGTVGAPEN